jgi:histidyl-tRNA synthetase
LNDRRLLDQAIIKKASCDPLKFNTICSSIDKLDKTPWLEVSNELLEKGLTPESVEEIGKFVSLKAES